MTTVENVLTIKITHAPIIQMTPKRITAAQVVKKIQKNTTKKRITTITTRMVQIAQHTVVIHISIPTAAVKAATTAAVGGALAKITAGATHKSTNNYDNLNHSKMWLKG